MVSKIVLIGAGNTAWALGRALAAVGHEIVQVWSRSLPSAISLATQVGAVFTTDIATLDPDADLYILAVSDDAAATVAAQIKLKRGVIVHTSGILDMAILATCGISYGVLYPFVSMTRDRQPDFDTVTLFIESSNPQSLSAIRAIAHSISSHVREMPSSQRMNLHLAGVFANNFTNQLLVIADILLEEHGLTFDEIRPMLANHLTALQQYPPAALQTGVAYRRDTLAMDKHQALLASHPTFRHLYILLSESIQQLNKKTI
jgi:predicted short-subunit dehydrogenase-like oxidoreductase (DUF2520 family)